MSRMPEVTVTLDDGSTFTAQTDNRDAVAWDMYRARKQWPAASAAPMLWITFLAWHTQKRAGIQDLAPFDQWESHCVDVETLEDDQDPTASGDLDPIQPEARPNA